MPRDKRAIALSRLMAAHAEYEVAWEGIAKARQNLIKQMGKAVEADIPKAEIARVCKTSPQRVHQRLQEGEAKALAAEATAKARAKMKPKGGGGNG
jgi:hypothetical protein